MSDDFDSNYDEDCSEDSESDRNIVIYPVTDENGETVWIGEEEYRKLQLTKNAECLYSVMVITWLLALYLEGDAA